MFSDDDVDEVLIRAAVNADDTRAVTHLHDTERNSGSKNKDEIDLELALKLSAEYYNASADHNSLPNHVDLNSSSASDVVEFDRDDDFEFALKLSKKLNYQDLPASGENSSTSSASNDVTFDQDADFELALKLSEEESQSRQRNNSPSTCDNSNSSSNIVKFDEDRDFELALTLSAELNDPLRNLPASNRSTNLIEPFDDNQDFELAIKRSLELRDPTANLPSFSRSSNSVVPFDDDRDFELALKLSTELTSDFSQNGVSSVTRKEGPRNNVKTVHTIPVYDVENDIIVKKVMRDIIASEKTEVPGYSYTRSFPNMRMPAEANESVTKYLNKDISVVDSSWETIDPNPDIHAMFVAFNKRFFWGQLGMVEVKWSPRMTLCAGNCTYKRMAGHCVVNLSKPLLQLRPRKDLVETLLHEMIHAYLFVTHNDRDRDGHGPRFHSHMRRINRESGAKISVYHNFHDEVKYYKQHEWRCNGPCRERPPFYGYVRRSMNRAPGPYDNWWDDHAARCNGQFVKTKEPEGYKNRKAAAESRNALDIKNKGSKYDIENFFKTKSFKSPTSGSSKTPASTPVSAQSAKFLAVSKNVVTNVAVNTPSTGPRIFTINDLSDDNSASKNGQSQSISAQKWVPLQGQGNIRYFFNKS